MPSYLKINALKNYNRVISLGCALYFRITISIMASLGRAVTTLGVRSSICNSLRTSLAYCTKSFADPKTCDANTVNLVTHTGQVNIYSIKSVIKTRTNVCFEGVHLWLVNLYWKGQGIAIFIYKHNLHLFIIVKLKLKCLFTLFLPYFILHTCVFVSWAFFKDYPRSFKNFYIRS